MLFLIELSCKCWFRHLNGPVQSFQGNRAKEKTKQMREHWRTCLGAFLSWAGKQCFILAHGLLLVRTENLLSYKLIPISIKYSDGRFPAKRPTGRFSLGPGNDHSQSTICLFFWNPQNCLLTRHHKARSSKCTGRLIRKFSLLLNSTLMGCLPSRKSLSVSSF